MAVEFKPMFSITAIAFKVFVLSIITKGFNEAEKYLLMAKHAMNGTVEFCESWSLHKKMLLIDIVLYTPFLKNKSFALNFLHDANI